MLQYLFSEIFSEIFVQFQQKQPKSCRFKIYQIFLIFYSSRVLRSRSLNLGARKMFRDSWSNFFGSLAPQQNASVMINGVPHHHHTSHNSHHSSNSQSTNRSNNHPSSSSHAHHTHHRPSNNSSSRRNSSNSHSHGSSRNNGFTFGINIDQIMDEVEESINSTIDGFT